MRRFALNTVGVLAVCALAFVLGLGGCSYTVPVRPSQHTGAHRYMLPPCEVATPGTPCQRPVVGPSATQTRCEQRFGKVCK